MQINMQNPIIYSPSISFESLEFKLQRRLNNFFKMKIEREKRKGNINNKRELILHYDANSLIPSIIN